MVKYQKYKEINLSWLKIIPANWDIKRNKQFLHERKKIVGNKSSEYTLLSLTLRGIVVRDLSENKGKIPASFDNYKIVEPGDIAFCLFDIDETPRTVGLSKYKGMLTGAYNIFHIEGINARYLYYYYLALDNIKGLRPLYTGLRKTINVNTFLSQQMPVPPRSEQDQIVRFLDWKVSEINKLIGIRRKEIQELEGLKKVIVHKAITGKNCDTATRDTSIEWIGAIPAEWEILHVKNVAIITNGSDPKTEGNIPVYGSGDGSFKTCGEYKEGPAVLIGRKGATLHIPHYVEGKYWNVDTAFDVHMKDDNDLRWFYYLAQCFDYQFYISQTTLPSMTQTDYNNMPIPVPSVPVQHEIASYLDRENLKIDKAIDLTERKIDALTEMKNTLISDVVTGKIDVRNITVPEYEHVDDIVDDDSENNEETETDGEEA